MRHLCLAVSLFFAFSAPALASDQSQGIISFTFDDASVSQYQNGFRLAQSHSIVGTLFVPTALVDRSTEGTSHNWLMTWEEVREIHEAGWEIASHSQTHARLPELNRFEVEGELQGSMSDIEEKVGIRPVSFSSPNGAFNDETIDQIMGIYDNHLSWLGHLGRNPIDTIDRRYIGRFEVTNSMSSTLVCGEMLRAALTNTWLVLLFHGIVDEDPGQYQISARKFDEIAACAARLSEAGIVQIKTIRDAAWAIEALD